MSKTVLITGASGFVGSNLIKHFAEKGWQVKALVPAYEKVHVKPASFVEYQINKPFDETVFADADYLIHLAYMKKDRQNPDAFEQNVEGAKKLLAISRKHKLQKNIFMSSMSAQEDALSTYGKQKLAIEKIFNGTNDVVLRSGLVIGRGGLMKETVKFMRSKRVVPLIDGGLQPLQVISIYDLVTIMDKMLGNNLSGNFTIANPNIYSYRQFYQTIAKQLGIKVVFVPLPFIIPHLAIRTIHLLHLPLNITEDNLLGLKKLRSVDTNPDLRRIGIELDSLEVMLPKLRIKDI